MKKNIEHVSVGSLNVSIDTIRVQIKITRGSILVTSIYLAPRKQGVDTVLADIMPQNLVGNLNNKSVGWNRRRTNTGDRRLGNVLDDHGAMASGYGHRLSAHRSLQSSYMG